MLCSTLRRRGLRLLLAVSNTNSQLVSVGFHFRGAASVQLLSTLKGYELVLLTANSRRSRRRSLDPSFFERATIFHKNEYEKVLFEGLK